MVVCDIPHRTRPPLLLQPHCLTTAIMKPPSTALLRTFSPLWQSAPIPWRASGCLALQQSHAFSSTPQRQKRNKGGPKTDPRICAPSIHRDGAFHVG